MSKPKPITTRGLPNMTLTLADLLVERLGIDAIRKAAGNDRQQGIYALIRPELPSGVTNAEVRNVAIIMAEAAKPQPMPATASSVAYDIYLREN